MPITIGTNIASLQAQRRLNESDPASLFEKLASGMRINRASDDAAGLAISDDLNLRTRVYTKAILNGNDAQSLLSIADSTLGNLSTVVTRIRELSQQSANGTFSSTQRASLDAEAQALKDEFFRISRSASFNGINLFDGSLGSGIRFQLGFGTDGSLFSSVGGKLGTGSITPGSNDYRFTSAGTTASDVALGDLNGDGFADMVTTSGNGLMSYFNIRLGNGDGTFGATTSLTSVIGSSNAVTLGDLNGDGYLDMVAVGTSGGAAYAAVRLGNGNGTFGASTTYTTAGEFGVQLADLNGDGVLDLVAAGGAAGGTLGVRLGVGDGTFSTLQTFAGGGVHLYSDLFISDLNGDGKLDVGVIDTGRSGYATMFFGNGNGTFGGIVSYDMGFSSGTGISAGDLNGDGILDLVAVGNAGTGYTSIRLGNGDGTFRVAVTYADVIAQSEMVLSDMNGDGKLDLVSTGSFGGEGYATIRLGNGDGTFGSSTSFISDKASSAGITAGDINGDGVVDIVTAGVTDGAASSTTLFGLTRDGVSPILPFSLKTKADSLQAMSMLDRTLSNLSLQRGVIGASQSRVGIAIGNLQSARESFVAARSRIIDLDIASASADMVRIQILQKTATAILAQANQAPKLALSLITGKETKT